jgi:acyl carrier protein
MSDQEFLSRFSEVVGTDAASIGLETELRTLEGWDSVAYLGTTVLIEEEMGIAIQPDVLTDSVTIGDILKAARKAKG